MRCRVAISFIALASTGACGFDSQPEIVMIPAVVGETIGLVGGDPEGDEDDSSFSWSLESIPAESVALLQDGAIDRALLSPDVAGRYVVDRWLYTGAADRWTHRFYVDAQQGSPVAKIEESGLLVVGETITLDGSASDTVAELPLTYHWRLAVRPARSAAELSSFDQPLVTLQPDEPGRYTVELDVLRQDTWSEVAARVHLDVESPQ